MMAKAGSTNTNHMNESLQHFQNGLLFHHCNCHQQKIAITTHSRRDSSLILKQKGQMILNIEKGRIHCFTRRVDG